MEREALSGQLGSDHGGPLRLHAQEHRVRQQPLVEVSGAKDALAEGMAFLESQGRVNVIASMRAMAIAGDKATLALDVSGAERDAAMAGRSETQKYEDIAFASVNLSGLKRDGNTWSATAAPAVLTSAGHQAFDMITMLGFVILLGTVVNNPILIVEQTRRNLDERQLPIAEAVREAVASRLRPILMTTLAALFAALPLMFGWGEGAELRRPLGLAIFGGLVLSQILNDPPAVVEATDHPGGVPAPHQARRPLVLEVVHVVRGDVAPAPPARPGGRRGADIGGRRRAGARMARPAHRPGLPRGRRESRRSR